MKTLIACCGLNCEECGARIATINNDNELRRKTAEEWSKQFGAIIPLEAINCTGCRIEGVKLGHCSECQVRNCAVSKGFDTCAECSTLETCEIVGQIHQFTTEALENLKSLHN